MNRRSILTSGAKVLGAIGLAGLFKAVPASDGVNAEAASFSSAAPAKPFTEPPQALLDAVAEYIKSSQSKGYTEMGEYPLTTSYVVKQGGRLRVYSVQWNSAENLHDHSIFIPKNEDESLAKAKPPIDCVDAWPGRIEDQPTGGKRFAKATVERLKAGDAIRLHIFTDLFILDIGVMKYDTWLTHEEMAQRHPDADLSDYNFYVPKENQK